MFIVWGTRGYQKVFGNSIIHRECQNCHNEVTMQIIEVGSKFTIFWIPLFTMSKKYYLICPICHQGIQISKADAQEYLMEE